MILKDIFLPCPIQKKRAKALQHQVLLGYSFFISALIFSMYFVALSVPGILGYATNISVGDLLRYTNEKRSKIGVRNLVLNETLSKAAEAKALDMFRNDYWAHTSPSGKEPWDFIIASGYDYLYAGENLAVDFSESKGVVDAWYESPTHKANLISDKYTDIGFAVVDGELQGRKTTLVVQMFGYPRSQMANVPTTSLKNIEPVDVENAPVDTNDMLSAKEPAIKSVEGEKTEIITRRDVTIPSKGAVLNTSTIFDVSRYMAVLFGLFLTLMFAVDGYYVRKLGILRISGHTILHILILILVIVGIWYTHIGLIL